MAAQPFGDRERRRKREHARWPARPDEPREGKPQTGEEREISRQSRDSDRQQPSKSLGVDQEGIADPIEAGEEIAETETPAGYEGSHHAAEPPGEDAVHQPDQNRKGQEQHRPEIGWRREAERRKEAIDPYDRHQSRHPPAIANVDTAPAVKAISARRHPQASTIACASRVMPSGATRSIPLCVMPDWRTVISQAS